MNNDEILTESELAILRLLRTGPLEMDAVAESAKLNQSQVMAAAVEMQQRGLVNLSESERQEIIPEEGAADLISSGLPERRAAEALEQAGGEMPLENLMAWAGEHEIAVNEIIRWGQTRGWLRKIRIEGSAEASKRFKVVLTVEGRSALGAPQDDERALQHSQDDRLFLDQLTDLNINPDSVRKLLAGREGVARIKKRTQRALTITVAGIALLDSGMIVKVERNALTSDDIKSGRWREISLRKYDIGLPARAVVPAKTHPLRRIMEETRRAFLEMGFTEAVSPMVESAFWNFDALFQPQDHPARDMQDTFYMAEPNRLELPEDALVYSVSQTHENGWETGSQGWGYRWDPEQARRAVLRTHTTAATIRALARHPEPPLKVFCVGWTFRNETISYKHLPVFHQVDGIVIDKEANLSTLLGTLSEFYRKMGFEKVKFKPAFYPYTEPSADVVVYMESRKKWMEMGGSGIFRPEVTQPLGCRYPVLAWGLGIERLAMLRLGFDDIRELYRCALDQMEEVPLCR
ncbi:MAG TPA: phenylalanine--tRNA ligase subunit alpha [Pyrinomonadaceae bacterium]|nr:phenylalanine--tRNA ligase subunit alpha [Pyrinomonadaceae bacterium]